MSSEPVHDKPTHPSAKAWIEFAKGIISSLEKQNGELCDKYLKGRAPVDKNALERAEALYEEIKERSEMLHQDVYLMQKAIQTFGGNSDQILHPLQKFIETIKHDLKVQSAAHPKK